MERTTPPGGTPGRWVVHRAGRSDVGRVRQENQDAFGLFPDVGLYVVADGLGGHQAGSVASRMVVDEIRRSLGTIDADDLTPVTAPNGAASLAGRRLVIAMQDANQHVRDASRDPTRRGMGSTVAALLFDHSAGVVAVGHVGDSRVYRVRDDRIDQLTEDHTVVQQWVREGKIGLDEARTSPHRHMITQAVGTQDIVNPSLRLECPAVGDVFVLTSDGVHDLVGAEEIADVVRTALPDLEAASFRLVELANERGGKDNSTAVLVRCVGLVRPEQSGDEEPTVGV